MREDFLSSAHRPVCLMHMHRNAHLLLCALLAGCSASADPAPDDDDVPASHLRYFGYVAVDCGWDDPHDASPKSSYLDEVASFTNLAHMCAYGHTDDVRARLDAMERARVRPLLDVSSIFWVDVDDDTMVVNYDLAPDYAEHWVSFVAANGLATRDLGAIYPVDEPILNGVTYDELAEAVVAVKTALPNAPVLVVEAYTELAELRVPAQVDWLGFDRYGVADPEHDPEFLQDLETLKTKRTRADQKIFLVLEGQHWPEYNAYGFPPEAMGGIAMGYYQLAAHDPDIVGLLGYLWPGGLDGPPQLGTRDLPEAALDVHRQIGAAITGK